MDCRPPGSSVHGILQTRILGWIAIPFYRGSSWLRDITQFFCIAGRFFTIWATRKAPKKVPYFPSNWYAILHTRQHLNICSCGSIFSSAFGVVRVLDFGHFNRCVVVCDCCFNLHFPGDIRKCIWRAFSHPFFETKSTIYVTLTTFTDIFLFKCW